VHVTSQAIGQDSLLRGKYRLVRLLGEGGMGRVFEALHVDLDRRVAIKLLHDELRDNADIVERFVREGRAASRIECDHVAKVLDVDRVEDGTPFIVMEFLEGRDLAFVRRTKSPLPVQEAVDYVLQTCVAIGKAHARGVIHRDLKPANLFLARLGDGTRMVKVLDFGISKMADVLGSSQPSITRTTMIMGSVEYMSPEQMLSTRDVDGRTDLWALGVVLFELLTAAMPFSGETVTQVCAQVMSQQPIRPTSLRADLPAALEEFVLRALEKDRTRRFATAEEFARALRAVVPLTHVGLGPVTSPVPERASEPPVPAGAQAAPAESRMSGVPGVPSLTGPFPVGVGVGTGVGNGAGTGAGHGSGTGAGTGAGATSSMVVLSTSSTGGELLPSGGLAGDAENQGQTRLSGSSPPQAHGSASSPQIPITTHVGVASDPIPQPPRRKGAAAWVAGGVLLCGLGALGLTHLLGRDSGGSTPGRSTDAASPAARSSV